MIDEDLLCECFRCYRGGYDFLGVKSPWWAKLNTGWEQEACKETKNVWRPTKEQIDLANVVLFKAMLMLRADERKVLIARCGTGFKRSYRKCGKDVGLHHEVFRKEFQLVMIRLQKILDEMA